MNKHQIIKNELNKLNNSKANAEIEANTRLLRARELPAFCEADNAYRKLMLEIAKLPPEDKKHATLNKKLASLKKARLDVLKKLGISASALEPKYSCKKCNDTGYVGNTMCDCLKIKVQKALIKQSGLNNKLNFDFSKCDEKILAESPLLAKAYRFAHKYCDNFPNNKEPNLVFYGEVGTGKTFLLECIANELINKLYYVVFTTAYDISKTMIKAFNSPYSERDTILSPLFESDLLIIDDLGTEPLYHESALTNLFTLINERQRNNQALIISTNLSPQQIDERYGNRIKSRLFNQRITVTIPFKSRDLRLK